MSNKFEHLSNFILNQMRMSHIYQPVMLKELLIRRGSATSTEIARALLNYDASQIEYYDRIAKNMVGRVLTNNRGITSRKKNEFSLIGFEELSQNHKDELIRLCETKIAEFLQHRGDRVWNHRRMSSGYISGTLRYEILKKAKYRCELCGIPADQKALEVDHIVPRNSGGSDDLSNLQALCYSCNAMKRDRDDTDFRKVCESYSLREPNCIFCEIPKERIIAENELAYSILDSYPVTELHTLFIPKRHVPDYFALYKPELNAISQLIEIQRREFLDRDNTITGFNIGNNVGEDAGQTVMHCHTHLIPRREGDINDPRGGVRGVIPDRQKY